MGPHSNPCTQKETKDYPTKNTQVIIFFQIKISGKV